MEFLSLTDDIFKRSEARYELIVSLYIMSFFWGSISLIFRVWKTFLLSKEQILFILLLIHFEKFSFVSSYCVWPLLGSYPIYSTLTPRDLFHYFCPDQLCKAIQAEWSEGLEWRYRQHYYSETITVISENYQCIMRLI